MLEDDVLNGLTKSAVPQSIIQILFKNGAGYKTTSVEKPDDFMKLWKDTKGTVTLLTDADAYLSFNKDDVMCISANPKIPVQ